MNTKWSLPLKVGFLFLFSYILLYVNSNQFFLTFLFDSLWQRTVPGFANLLGHEDVISTKSTGSGDKAYNFFSVLLFAVLSVCFAIIMSFILRKKENHDQLLSWMTFFIRYFLAAQMISYGLAKLYYLQFQYPSLVRMDQRLGDFSPMGLLWTFMGYSKGYTMFTGFLEFVGGLLLLSRYTTTLGALVTFGVMLNVMMLNYCYDVPVKLLSTHMVLMSLFLVALDGKRLWNFFIRNKSVEPFRLAGITPIKYETIKRVSKWTLIFGYLGYSFFRYESYVKKRNSSTGEQVYFKGKYQVEDFLRYEDSTTLEVLANPFIWKTIHTTNRGGIYIKDMDDGVKYYDFEEDQEAKLFKFKKREDEVFHVLKYEELEGNQLRLYGPYQDDSLNMVLIKGFENENLLERRKFHWISEYPFNR